jgi:hypothetical protein
MHKALLKRHAKFANGDTGTPGYHSFLTMAHMFIFGRTHIAVLPIVFKHLFSSMIHSRTGSMNLYPIS